MAESNKLLDTSIYTSQQNPLTTASQAVGLAQGITNQERGQVALDSDKIDLVHKQMGILQGLTSALAAKPDLSRQDFMDESARAVSMGLVGKDQAVQVLSGLAKVGNDPNALRLYARQLHLQTLDAGQRFGQIYGTPQVVDTGPNLGVIRPGLNGVQGMGTIPKGLSPEAETAPTTVPTPQGGQRVMTRGQFVGATGASMPGQPRQATPQAKAGTATPTTAAAAGGLPGLAGPAPGVAEAASVAGTQAGTQLSADRASAADYQAKIFPLNQAITSLEKLGPQGTGPGTEGRNLFKSAAISLGIPGSEKLTDSVADYDKAKKYLTDYVNQNGNTGTNDKLAAAFAGNPSVNISNAAAVDVAKSALALRRMKQAQVMAFERSGLPPDQYQAFTSQWNGKQDPRAYGLDIMTGAAQKKLLDGLQGEERKRFIQSVQAANEAGVLQARR